MELPALPLQGPRGASSLMKTPLLSSCLRALSSSTLTALLEGPVRGEEPSPSSRLTPSPSPN